MTLAEPALATSADGIAAVPSVALLKALVRRLPFPIHLPAVDRGDEPLHKPSFRSASAPVCRQAVRTSICSSRDQPDPLYRLGTASAYVARQEVYPLERRLSSIRPVAGRGSSNRSAILSLVALFGVGSRGGHPRAMSLLFREINDQHAVGQFNRIAARVVERDAVAPRKRGVLN